jgi:predicted RNA-binding Zn-ribbon protein involved in translation (DUF1610 family)
MGGMLLALLGLMVASLFKQGIHGGLDITRRETWTCAVAAVLAAAALSNLVSRAYGRVKLNHRSTQNDSCPSTAQDDAANAQAVKCPECGDTVIARTAKYRVRCLSCEHRFQVDPAAWRGLPVSRAGLQGHTLGDSLAVIGYTPFSMTRRTGVYVVVFFVVAPGLSAVLLDELNCPWWTWLLVWCVTTVFGLLLLARWANSEWSRHRLPTHCKCGYDIRHSVERCPECGATIRHADGIDRGKPHAEL